MKVILTATVFLFVLISHGQDYNKEVVQENGKKFLIGKIDQEGLNKDPYRTWFQPGYASYTVDTPMIEMFKNTLA